jgi:hypothetical protein
MSLQNSAQSVYASYNSFFEPANLSPNIGYTKQQQIFVRPVIEQVVDETRSDFPPEQWVARVAVACIEVIHGKRSVAQVRKICSHRVAQDLLIKQSVLSSKKNWSMVRITKVKFATGIKDSIEVSINFEYENQTFPMAMNLGLTKDGWRINACEIGPH